MHFVFAACYTDFDNILFISLASPTPTRIPLSVSISPEPLDPVSYVLPGANFNRTCTVNLPDATIMWIYPRTNNVIVTNVNRTTVLLEIERFELTNVGLYRCEATFGDMNVSKTLNVTGKIRLVKNSLLSIVKIHKLYIRVYLYLDVSKFVFLCRWYSAYIC